MGLAVSTDLLADLLANDAEGASDLLAELEIVNRVLAEHRLPAHHEPRELPPSIRRDAILGFPYGFLHHLRRAYAHCLAHADWVASPTGADADPADDELLAEAMDQMDSHLLCHSDCEGFYVPIAFDEVLFDEQQALAGGMLGSSQSLQRELTMLAPALGIALSDGQLSDAQVAAIGARIDAEDALHIELTVWLCLFEACRESIAHRSAICFC